ncbi:MAG: alpha/beta fold hydrolase [Acidobacteria bacterium]|nr:alpha/beta fold hydrolase [Acidobacteriota bacterium]
METIKDSDWPGKKENAKAAAQIPAQALSPRLAEVARLFRTKPFFPHRLARGGHAQTLVAGLKGKVNTRLNDEIRGSEARTFEVAPGASLLAHCRWQSERRAAPTLVLVHGLEGSSRSHYMRGTARKAFTAGLNVVGVNLRNCGDSEHLTETLYHSGMSGDIRRVVEELAEHDGLRTIFVAGFSMGGNIVLKLAGEYGERPPESLAGVCAVSPSLDLSACADRLEQRENRIYMSSFLHSLHRRIRRKQRRHPNIYDARGLRSVRTIREFDERFTAPHAGFRDAADYYAQSSALPLVARIRVPTLILHAADDPLIPASSFLDPSLALNPEVLLVMPPRGGHVAFIADAASGGEDRFWAENRVVEFCRLLAGALPAEGA